MSDIANEIRELKALLDEGLIDEDEFSEQKSALLAAQRGETPQPSGPDPLLDGGTVVDSSSQPPSHGQADPLLGATAVEPSGVLPVDLPSYKILGILGAGGMGTVVRARHIEEGWAKRQGGDVAIKLIHPHIASDPSFRERFLNEAALGKRVDHPSFCTVHDVGLADSWLYTVMQLVEGNSLGDRVKPGGLPVDEALALLGPIAEALDHLHSKGIVHRDLKPSNVMVTADGRPVVLDLGIAKDTSSESSNTQVMTTMGTKAWMAPEQADAKSVGPAADRYALGMLAYALLSGAMPWPEGSTLDRIIANKLMGQLRPLSEAKPGLPASVTSAVMSALSVAPSERPDSCADFVAALAEAPVHTTASQPTPGPTATGAARATGMDPAAEPAEVRQGQGPRVEEVELELDAPDQLISELAILRQAQECAPGLLARLSLVDKAFSQIRGGWVLGTAYERVGIAVTVLIFIFLSSEISPLTLDQPYKQVTAALLALVVLAGATVWYRKKALEEAMKALEEAMKALDRDVGPLHQATIDTVRNACSLLQMSWLGFQVIDFDALWAIKDGQPAGLPNLPGWRGVQSLENQGTSFHAASVRRFSKKMTRLLAVLPEEIAAREKMLG